MSQIHELKGIKIGRAATKILYTWNVGGRDEIKLHLIYRDKFSTIYVPKCCCSDMFLKIDLQIKGSCVGN
jgi:hypothetical protein